MDVRRVNFYGGPNIGKTNLVKGLFNELNTQLGISVGMADEIVKNWAYEDRSPKGFDQYYLLGGQILNEETILRNSPEIVLCECPLLLGAYYSKRHGVPGWYLIRDAALLFEEFYPGVHIILERGDWEYKQEGRYESEEESREIDSDLSIFLDECSATFRHTRADGGEGGLKMFSMAPVAGVQANAVALAAILQGESTSG